jgi:4-hydroxy-3-methylbut-2-enyl diphosphate reductase
MDILLANPRGFCAGVERAIAIVERALEQYGAPIYVRHEVVHNKFVVDGLRAKGAVFVEELDEVPDGATVIFSAHGVPQAVRSRGRTARTARVRRHLPAGDQGALRGGAPAQAGARSS